MNSALVFFVLLLSVGVFGSDQIWWNSIRRILCTDDHGHAIQVSDHKLIQLEAQCHISRQDAGPVSTCATAGIKSGRDLLSAFCDQKTFSCIESKPLLTEQELQLSEKPEQLKQELVDCISNVMKYDYYLFDEKFNFN